MESCPQVDIYTDGSAKGNPGPGGYAAILRFYDSAGRLHEKELSCGYTYTTNNRMEMLGVISALESLKRPCSVVVHTDSQYIANAFNQHWVDKWQKNGWTTKGKKPVKNIDLWKRLLKASEMHNVKYVWVRGHAGNDLNERCDAIAVKAASGDYGALVVDEGF